MLLSWLACNSPAEKWSDCTDASCRAEVADAAFAEDAERVIRDLAALTDPLEQAVLLEQLAHADPSQQSALCNAVPRGSQAGSRCQQLMLRPHLYQVRYKREGSTRSRKAAGPSQGAPPTGPAYAPFWKDSWDSEAVWAACTKGDSACLTAEAQGLARRGEAERAAWSCFEAWPEGVARHECHFQVGELLTRTGGVAELSHGLALCEASGELVRHCAQHVVMSSLPAACPADTPDERCVTEMLAAIETIKTQVGGRDGLLMADYAWSSWTRESLFLAEDVTGHLLEHLPAEAHPHVRAAAAWRYFMLYPPDQDTTMDGVAGALKGKLAKSGPMSANGDVVSLDKEAMAKAMNGTAYPWLADSNELESALPAVYYMATGRRAFSSNEDDELRICALEAGARSTPFAQIEFFTGAIGGEHDEAVQWTAARLVASIYPGSRAQVRTLATSELVREGTNIPD